MKNKKHMIFWKKLSEIIQKYKPYEIEQKIIFVRKSSLSNDSSFMELHISSLPHDVNDIIYFQRNEKFYRHLLSQNIQTKRVPKIKFSYCHD